MEDEQSTNPEASHVDGPAKEESEHVHERGGHAESAASGKSSSPAEKLKGFLSFDRADAGNASRKLDPDAKVRYLNGESLSRPLDMPNGVKRGMLAALVAAAIIGCAFLAWYFDGVANGPKRQEQAIEETLAKEVSYDLPDLYSLMPLDDEGILAALHEANLPIFEVPAQSERSVLQIVKLPPDMNVVDAGMMYASGVSKLSAADAAKLLNGSWDLQVDRENGVNMVVHFADFSAATVDEAIQTALTAEGLNETNITESGEDSAGNTFTAGTIDGENGSYSWRVSALPLSKIYSIDGLPQNAVYVGIRMTS